MVYTFISCFRILRQFEFEYVIRYIFGNRHGNYQLPVFLPELQLLTGTEIHGRLDLLGQRNGNLCHFRIQNMQIERFWWKPPFPRLLLRQPPFHK